MGYNTPALFLNDAAGEIARDRDLGEKIAQAMTTTRLLSRGTNRIDLTVGNHGNAVSILPAQHSNDHSLLHLHGNLLTRQISFSYGGQWDDPEATLRAAAKTLGFKLVKNNPRRG